jgi:hypothetical protein
VITEAVSKEVAATVKGLLEQHREQEMALLQAALQMSSTAGSTGSTGSTASSTAGSRVLRQQSIKRRSTNSRRR